MNNRPIVLALTGASGVVYAIRLLDMLLRRACEVHLTISPSGQVVLEQELGIAVDLERFRAADLTVTGRPAADPPTEMSRTLQRVAGEPGRVAGG